MSLYPTPTRRDPVGDRRGERVMDADALAKVATNLIVKVRDDDPVDVHRWLTHTLGPDPRTWIGLCMVLAAAVPDDRPWSELVAWIEPPEERRRRQWRESQRRARSSTEPSTGEAA